MTFVEAAIELLRQAGRPLHFKELAQRAVKQNLLSHVGRTPEQTMQTRLADELKRGATPLTRVSPGIFGLRYGYERPDDAPAPEARSPAKEKPAERKRATRAVEATDIEAPTEAAPEDKPEADGEDGATKRRRRRRGGRGRGGRKVAATPATTAEVPVDAEIGTPEEALAAERLAAEAEAEAEYDEPEAEAETPVRRAAGQPQPDGFREPAQVISIPNEFDVEALAKEYAEELTGVATMPVEGELVDEQTADEDRPMLEEIGGGRDRDRHGRRRRGGRGRGDRGDRGRRDSQAQAPQAAPPQRSQPRPQQPRQPHPQSGRQPVPPRPQPARAPLQAAPLVQPFAPTTTPGRESLAETAYRLLRSLNDPRPVHTRQLAAMAVKRRLVTGEVEELWKTLELALLADVRQRMAAGLRPRVRHQGGGLFTLVALRLEPELTRQEDLLAEHADSQRRATMQALCQRFARLPQASLEAMARIYLEHAGCWGVERAKRVDATTYFTAQVSRGAAVLRLLVGVRSGAGPVDRRSVGELRAGVVAKQLDEGLLLAAASPNEEAEREMQAHPTPVVVLAGEPLAIELLRAGVGVVRATLPVWYLDTDFFAELGERTGMQGARPAGGGGGSGRGPAAGGGGGQGGGNHGGLSDRPQTPAPSGDEPGPGGEAAPLAVVSMTPEQDTE